MIKGFEAKFDVPILEGYGLSETSPVACFNQLDRPCKAGSIGQPIWLTDMRIVNPMDDTHKALAAGEVGEVGSRPSVDEGLLQKARSHGRGGAKRLVPQRRPGQDGQGGLLLHRSPAEGDDHPRRLQRLPASRGVLHDPSQGLAVAVKGIPDEKLGEEIKAYLVLKPDQTATVDEMMDFAKEGLAAYKYPRYIEFRSALPMTATGKILKRELVDE